MFKRTAKTPEFHAPFNKLQRRLRLVQVELKFNGVFPTIALLWAYFTKKIGLRNIPVRKMGQSWPDNRIDVLDLVNADLLSISKAQREHANGYEATPDLEFRFVLEMLKLDYTKYRFCDYGSGKGAVLAVAALYPFRQVTGIEFCPSLHAIALENIEKLSQSENFAAKIITPVLRDATAYEPPAEPHVFYFYNPFKPAILRGVLDQCQTLADTATGQSYIMFKNPVHREFLDARSGLEKIWEPFGGSWAIYKIVAQEDAYK